MDVLIDHFSGRRDVDVNEVDQQARVLYTNKFARKRLTRNWEKLARGEQIKLRAYRQKIGIRCERCNLLGYFLEICPNDCVAIMERERLEDEDVSSLDSPMSKFDVRQALSRSNKNTVTFSPSLPEKQSRIGSEGSVGSLKRKSGDGKSSKETKVPPKSRSSFGTPQSQSTSRSRSPMGSTPSRSTSPMGAPSSRDSEQLTAADDEGRKGRMKTDTQRGSPVTHMMPSQVAQRKKNVMNSLTSNMRDSSLELEQVSGPVSAVDIRERSAAGSVLKRGSLIAAPKDDSVFDPAQGKRVSSAAVRASISHRRSEARKSGLEATAVKASTGTALAAAGAGRSSSAGGEARKSIGGVTSPRTDMKLQVEIGAGMGGTLGMIDAIRPSQIRVNQIRPSQIRPSELASSPRGSRPGPGESPRTDREDMSLPVGDSPQPPPNARRSLKGFPYKGVIVRGAAAGSEEAKRSSALVQKEYYKLIGEDPPDPKTGENIYASDSSDEEGDDEEYEEDDNADENENKFVKEDEESIARRKQAEARARARAKAEKEKYGDPEEDAKESEDSSIRSDLRYIYFGNIKVLAEKVTPEDFRKKSPPPKKAKRKVRLDTAGSVSSIGSIGSDDVSSLGTAGTGSPRVLLSPSSPKPSSIASLASSSELAPLKTSEVYSDAYDRYEDDELLWNAPYFDPSNPMYGTKPPYESDELSSRKRKKKTIKYYDPDASNQPERYKPLDIRKLRQESTMEVERFRESDDGLPNYMYYTLAEDTYANSFAELSLHQILRRMMRLLKVEIDKQNERLTAKFDVDLLHPSEEYKENFYPKGLTKYKDYREYFLQLESKKDRARKNYMYKGGGRPVNELDGMFRLHTYGDVDPFEVNPRAGACMHSKIGWKSVTATGDDLASSDPTMLKKLEEVDELVKKKGMWVTMQRTAMTQKNEMFEHIIKILRDEMRKEHERESTILLSEKQDKKAGAMKVWQERFASVDRLEHTLRQYKFTAGGDTVDFLFHSLKQWRANAKKRMHMHPIARSKELTYTIKHAYRDPYTTKEPKWLQSLANSQSMPSIPEDAEAREHGHIHAQGDSAMHMTSAVAPRPSVASRASHISQRTSSTAAGTQAADVSNKAIAALEASETPRGSMLRGTAHSHGDLVGMNRASQASRASVASTTSHASATSQLSPASRVSHASRMSEVSGMHTSRRSEISSARGSVATLTTQQTQATLQSTVQGSINTSYADMSEFDIKDITKTSAKDGMKVGVNAMLTATESPYIIENDLIAKRIKASRDFALERARIAKERQAEAEKRAQKIADGSVDKTHESITTGSASQSVKSKQTKATAQSQNAGEDDSFKTPNQRILNDQRKIKEAKNYFKRAGLEKHIRKGVGTDLAYLAPTLIPFPDAFDGKSEDMGSVSYAATNIFHQLKSDLILNNLGHAPHSMQPLYVRNTMQEHNGCTPGGDQPPEVMALDRRYTHMMGRPLNRFEAGKKLANEPKTNAYGLTLPSIRPVSRDVALVEKRMKEKEAAQKRRVRLQMERNPLSKSMVRMQFEGMPSLADLYFYED